MHFRLGTWFSRRPKTVQDGHSTDETPCDEGSDSEAVLDALRELSERMEHLESLIILGQREVPDTSKPLQDNGLDDSGHHSSSQGRDSEGRFKSDRGISPPLDSGQGLEDVFPADSLDDPLYDSFYFEEF